MEVADFILLILFTIGSVFMLACACLIGAMTGIIFGKIGNARKNKDES